MVNSKMKSEKKKRKEKVIGLSRGIKKKKGFRRRNRKKKKERKLKANDKVVEGYFPRVE